MKSRHAEDLRAQQLAHNVHCETLRADHQRNLVVELEKQNAENRSNFGKRKTSKTSKTNSLFLLENLNRKNAEEREEIERNHKKELAAVRLQLDRAMEISKIKVKMTNKTSFVFSYFFSFLKEREADLRIDDLTTDLKQKQTRIDQCLRDLNALQNQSEDFRNEIESRNAEIQRIYVEFQNETK